MKFEYRNKEICLNNWRDSDKRNWPYLTEEDATSNGIDIDSVVADVFLNNKKNNGSFLYYCGRKLMLNDVDDSSSLKLVGYIPCVDEEGKEGFIRILKKKRRIAALLLLLILLIGLLLGGWYFINQKNSVDLDEAAISYQMPNGMSNTNPEEIMIPVFSQLKMYKNSKKIAVGLANPEGNPCYFKYKIILNDSKETIYESKWIEPGTAVVEVNIKKDLNVGTYPITIKVESGSLDDPNVALNGGEIDSSLKVE